MLNIKYEYHILQTVLHGSHSFTDKKNPGLFQDYSGPHEKKNFQDLFGAGKCLNIEKKRHLLTIFRV